MLMRVKTVTTTLKIYPAASYKVTYTPHNAATLALGLYPNEMEADIHTKSCLLTFMEALQLPKVKTMVVHIYNQIPLRNKKEKTADTCKILGKWQMQFF
jgi:hypothetical protein